MIGFKDIKGMLERVSIDFERASQSAEESDRRVQFLSLRFWAHPTMEDQQKIRQNIKREIVALNVLYASIRTFYPAFSNPRPPRNLFPSAGVFYQA
jgi:hypothetical protein